jgi:hypothetical protein
MDEKSAISVRAAEIAGTIFSSTEPAIGNVAVVEPPLVIDNTHPQDPQPLQNPIYAPPGDLDTRTKLWNQAHNRPFQHRLILSQKCRPSGEKFSEFFKRRRMRYGMLASAGILCRETSSLYCRLRMKASHGSPTCGTFLMLY